MNANQLDNFFLNEEKKRPKPGFFPSKKQFKYLPKILSKKERNVVAVLALIIIGSIIYIPLSLYFNKTTPVASSGGTYSEGIIGEPRHINPALATNDADRDLVRLIYSSLTKYDNQGNIIGDLAESFDVSEDGLTYTFVLKDAEWHDGQPVTADDIVFTVNTFQNEDYNSPQRINWNSVLAERIDDKTAKLTLKNKYAQFLNNTTVGILPKHVWQNVKPINFSLSDLNVEPIGSGPYKFSELKKDSLGKIQSYELKAHKKYHDGRPYIDRVELKFYPTESELVAAYNRGDVSNISNISAQNLNRLKFQQRLDVKRIKFPRYFTVFFNPDQSETLSELDVRQALNHATDKTTVINEVLNGEALLVKSPVIPAVLGGVDIADPYAYDQNKARELLQNTEAEDLSITLTTSEWPEFVIVANMLKEQWESVGFNVELQIADITTMQQIIKDRSYEALLFGEVLTVDPDPFSFWHSSQKKSPGLNLAVYDDPEADRLLEEGRSTLDPLKRMSSYDDFQKVVLEGAPAIFLYSPLYIYPQDNDVRSNDIEIISVPSDRFSNINTWFISTKRIKK
jgi:peptide/nickel transport system substrate-binding protein